jgi:4-amino-4-deoxy-L-arabinose transferase-like glycosyltransferase
MTSIAAQGVGPNARWLPGCRFAVLVVIAILAWLPGLFTLPPLDRDESRFAQASRQMVESGNYIDIRFSNTPRYNKPIGIYWFQSAAVDLAKRVDREAESDIWVYRVPSFLSGLLAVFLAYWTARAYAPANTALVGASLLGLTLLMAAESEIATTDAALLAATLGAQGVLLRVWLAWRDGRRLSRALVLSGWAALGAGILIKGPVIAGVTSATVLALSLWQRDWRWLKTLRPFTGLGIAVLIVAPWAIAIGIASHGAFYQQSLGHDLGAKLIGGQESHGAPPGYYLALLSITFWPATLFLLPGLLFALRNRSAAHVQFLLCWAIACFLLFEAVPTKLPHYILPAYPALALLAASWIVDRGKTEETRLEHVLRYIASVQFLLVALALAAAFVLLPRFGDKAVPVSLFIASALTLVAAAGAAVSMILSRTWPALFACAGCAVLCYATLMLGVAPQLNELWLSKRAAALIVERAGQFREPLTTAVAGYAEPSLVFLLGDAVRITSGRDAANLASATHGFALIEDADRKAFLTRLSTLKAAAAPVGDVSGFNYSRGRKQHLTLYRVGLAEKSPGPDD